MSQSPTNNSSKRILVIGGTGIQGKAVVTALLTPQEDNGAVSPYSVRVLTRDSSSEKAQAVADQGAELVEGRFDDLSAVAAALEGCYGTFVNTDSFGVGEQEEIYAAIKIYEAAHRASVKHFIWSGLDWASKLGNFDLKYHAVHYEAKGIVSEFLQSQPSSPSGESLTWTIITIGPYLENLEGTLLGPLPQRENGKIVWATPVGDGHIPAVSVEDIAWWARFTFDHRPESSGQNYKIATELMTIDQLVETFTRVTGIPAIRKRISMDEFLDVHKDYFENPIVKEEKEDGPTVRETAAAMYRVWGDDLAKRDMDWVLLLRGFFVGLASFSSSCSFF
ncbi:hypothetical protein D9757_000949 [Collybiopsis confluens]|uniref:NmrA-like domain-containing protein n=1 Tax=Collybiopsis confluens TaxID=2823264 RepID=A0A8H5MG79_9AGAR|nr:hypothetical protein D9757_000949 [Collybiopsis confluens]